MKGTGREAVPFGACEESELPQPGGAYRGALWPVQRVRKRHEVVVGSVYILLLAYKVSSEIKGCV